VDDGRSVGSDAPVAAAEPEAVSRDEERLGEAGGKGEMVSPELTSKVICE
jgi:hypothetical protein